MRLLATLRAKKQNREVATLTVATDATHEGMQAPTVASVATVTVATLKKTPWAANAPTTPAPATDPDRWCWPHSEGMNSREIDTFTARLARFTDRGLTLADAEQQADRLVIRDRYSDDRRLCLECAHLPARTCRVLKVEPLRDLLQRCPTFKPRDVIL